MDSPNTYDTKALVIDSLGLYTSSDDLYCWGQEDIFDILAQAKKFYYSGHCYRFSVHKDSRGYWTASKRISGHLYKKRLGTTDRISLDNLLATETHFQDLERSALRRTNSPEVMIEVLKRRVEKLQEENDYLRSRLKMEQ